MLRALAFPTAMMLPQKEIATSAGVTRCVADFVRVFQRPAVVYIKHENYILVDDVRRLMDDGMISAIKYAIVRADPSRDDYLRALIDAVSPACIVSGMGEQPAITHMCEFGLPGFTSGCVCIRPDLSTRLLRAVQNNDLAMADQIRGAVPAAGGSPQRHSPHSGTARRGRTGRRCPDRPAAAVPERCRFGRPRQHLERHARAAAVLTLKRLEILTDLRVQHVIFQYDQSDVLRLCHRYLRGMDGGGHRTADFGMSLPRH